MKDTELQIKNWDPKKLKLLRNMKEEWVITGKAKDWKEFLLKLARVKQ